jgi:hypothetical protein
LDIRELKKVWQQSTRREREMLEGENSRRKVRAGCDRPSDEQKATCLSDPNNLSYPKSDRKG